MVGMATLSVSGLMLLFDMSTAIVTNYRRKLQLVEDHFMIKSISITNLRKTEDVECYINLRNNVNFASRLHNRLLCLEHMGDVHKAFLMSKHYYYMESKITNPKTKSANEFFFHNLGTNQASQFFFDLLDNGLHIRFIRHSPKFVNTFLAHTNVKKLILCGKFLLRVLLHYADLVKDILLISQIWKYYLGSNIMTLQQVMFGFPSVVLCIVFMSIVSSEVLSALTWWNSDLAGSHTINKRWLAMLFIPCMPAVIHYQEAKLSIKQLYSVKKVGHMELNVLLPSAEEANLAWYQSEMLKWHSLRARFRANENVGEHFVQIILLLLIKLLKG
jgi:hypothetical protein